jgi:MFS family permease
MRYFLPSAPYDGRDPYRFNASQICTDMVLGKLKVPRSSFITISTALALLAGFLVLFVGGGARFAIGLTLKPIVEHFGWDRSDLGLAVAVFQVVSAITMFMAGYLADRHGPRSILLAGTLISAAGIGAMGAISAPWHAVVLYGIIFAVGNGAASIIPVGVMVTRTFPDRTGLANSVVISGLSLGQLAVISALAAVLVTMSWQTVFAILGIAHLALIPLLIWAIPKTQIGPDVSRPSTGMGVAEAARTWQFWLLIAVYAICGFDDFFVSTHVVAFAQDRGLGAFVAGNLLAAMGLAALVGVFAAGAVSDRLGPMWPTAASFVIRILAFGLLMVDQSALSVAIFSLAFGITFLVTAPLTVLFVSEHFGRRHLGSLTGLITLVHHMSGGAGAYLGSVIFDSENSYDVVFPIMLMSSLIALLLVFPLRRRPA